MALGWLEMALACRTPSGCSSGTLQNITSLESAPYALPWPLGRGGGQQRSRQLLVKAEKVLHPLPLAREGLGAVAQIRRPVQFRMSLDQRRRHRKRVIQIRQRRRLHGARNCAGTSKTFFAADWTIPSCFAMGDWGRGKGVVNERIQEPEVRVLLLAEAALVLGRAAAVGPSITSSIWGTVALRE
jgi:hypothetical protein